jgi:hypothetical protein
VTEEQIDDIAMKVEQNGIVNTEALEDLRKIVFEAGQRDFENRTTATSAVASQGITRDDEYQHNPKQNSSAKQASPETQGDKCTVS